MARFIDREREIAELQALIRAEGPAIALLYGRRRVGKTYLLDHVCKKHRAFYYLAADSTEEFNRRELLSALGESTDREIDPRDYPTWRSVFRLLASMAQNEPLVVVLDELPYLMGTKDDIVSQLVAVWDREVEGRPLKVILCGSEISIMEGLGQGDSPLYGRISWAARLRPFDYLDSARMTPGREPRELAHIYGTLGGTPRFLDAIDEDEPFGDAVRRLVLSPRGEVHLQLSTLLQQERGLRETGDYQAVLKAVAEGRTDTNEIANAVGLQDRSYVVRRALETLESLVLIRRERDFDAGRRAAWRNRLTDHAVAFWYRFVHPNRARLERGEIGPVWETRVGPRMSDYMGWTVFEGLCAEAFLRHHERWGLPGSAEWSRWEGRDRNRRPIEIDIVARLDDGRLLTGEVKWSSRPVDTDVHFGLRRDLEDLGRSGQGWAREAVHTSAGHVYFSAAGFTDHFRQRAGEEGLVLIDLEEMYVGYPAEG
ncbi:MAG: ATP-binding protein [Gemmatimonadota bacterium]